MREFLAGEVVGDGPSRKGTPLFDQMLDGMIECRLVPAAGWVDDFIIVRTNPAFVEQTGFADCVGRTAMELSDRGPWPALLSLFTRVVETGRPARTDVMLGANGPCFVVTAYRTESDRLVAQWTAREVVAPLPTAEQRASQVTLHLQASALEAAANAIIITDTDGTVQYVNGAFSQLTGYASSEIVGRNMSVLRSGVQSNEFVKKLWETILAGNVWQGELVNRRKDGSLYDEAMTITPVRNDHGAITQFIAIKQDISVRKRHEAESALLRERHSLALDAVELGTWTLDFDVEGTITLDARAQRQLGFPRAIATSSEIAALLDPHEVLQAREDLGSAAAQGRTEFETIMRVVNVGGEPRWIQGRAKISFAGEGAKRHPVRVYGTCQDITQARRAAEELQRSEERYRSLVDTLEDVVFTADAERRITFVSRAIRRFGYEPAQLIGRDFYALIFSDDLGSVSEARARGDGQAFEYRLVDAEGTPRPVRSYIQTSVAAGGVDGMTGVIVDQTAQRSTEEQLRAAQKMEAVGCLAGGIAHDFNNLLSVILAYTELSMRSLPKEDSTQPDLEEVRLAARRAQALTRQLLTFSRREVARPEPIDLDGLVAGVGKMLKRVIGEDLELCFVSSPERHDIYGDRGYMEQLIMNLAVNARDAMPHGGRLTIALSNRQLIASDTLVLGIKPGYYVELSVRDTGCGMDEATRARIFEPFFTTKGIGKGTGLGLSTVYGIVQQSGGAIDVESAVNVGSTFRIYLPYCAAPAEKKAADAHGPTAVARGVETVLVVEDEPALRNVVRRLLQAAGYRVITAENGADALALAAQEGVNVDLVLTDMVMPGMSGQDLIDRMRQTKRDVKVVFTSGYTREMLEHEGARYFLPKPYDWRALTDIVRAAIDGTEPKSSEMVLREAASAVS